MSVLTRGQNLHVSSAYINNQHVHDKFFDFWRDLVTDMAGIVPQPDHRLGQIVLVPENTYARCVQHEKSSRDGFEPKPAGREHSQKMPACENQRIAIDP